MGSVMVSYGILVLTISRFFLFFFHVLKQTATGDSAFMKFLTH